MLSDEQDDPGIKVPPPLIYLLPSSSGRSSTRGRTSPSCHAVRQEP